MTTRTKLAEDTWKRMDKINAELFILTYGSIVAQLCNEFEEYAEVNKQLDRMGYGIGTRLVEDFLARTNIGRCRDLRETADILSKVGFKIYLNITPAVTNWSADSRAFSLILDDNPLADFVELPEDGRAQDELWFSNVLCGVIRGALEMLQVQVEAQFVSDVLRGDPATELRVIFVKMIDEGQPINDE
ncbi:hypothetical protein PYCC9005_000357 [Savitreella phatthalungensis]